MTVDSNEQKVFRVKGEEYCSWSLKLNDMVFFFCMKM